MFVFINLINPNGEYGTFEYQYEQLIFPNFNCKFEINFIIFDR